MTRNEFLNKWCPTNENWDGMEFDLISVINLAEEEKLLKAKEKIEFEEEGLPSKEEGVAMPEENPDAYMISYEDAKRFIKSVNFGQMRGQ